MADRTILFGAGIQARVQDDGSVVVKINQYAARLDEYRNWTATLPAPMARRTVEALKASGIWAKPAEPRFAHLDNADLQAIVEAAACLSVDDPCVGLYDDAQAEMVARARGGDNEAVGYIVNSVTPYPPHCLDVGAAR